ncbi:MAG TPA: hypothetical protein VFU21_08005 [Kofleriaceae bacterium]|nr:hypothetical protein [Kofleriaceae bacterium]
MVVPSRSLVVLATAAGTACGSEQPCEVDVLAPESLDGVAATDCGSLVAEGDDHPELEDAHDCVQGALDDRSSFLVIWKFAGIEGDVSSAYVGRVEGERLTVEHYQRAPDPTGSYTTSRRDCSQLVPMTTCDSSLLTGFLCFECEDPSAPDVLCSPDS